MNEFEKAYTLTFDDRDGYLYALVQADAIDRENALAYLREIADRCHELGYHGILLERDIPVMLTDSDLFFTTKDFAEMLDGIRLAIYNPHDEIREDMDFAIAIGTNRGAQFSTHSSIESAEKWLRTASEKIDIDH